MSVTRIEREAFVTSTDGTTIGYRQLGKGVGVILLHGEMKTSHDLVALAAALSDAFTVYVVDRRGRGLSGPHGDRYSVDTEVRDVQALVAATGARSIFGLSAGALVALRAARVTPALERVALYEPPFSNPWLCAHELALSLRRGTRARPCGGRRGDGHEGHGRRTPVRQAPSPILVPLLSLVMRLQGDGDGDEDEVPIRALAPTLRYDIEIVTEMADTLDDYRALEARVLLLGGSRSPAFLTLRSMACRGRCLASNASPFPILGTTARRTTASRRWSCGRCCGSSGRARRS